ncbi:CLUMA_CG016256, isoform A [Clunio marinus]|uniref:CLUMA_CG016256, isoform A n=1 Tax=Clunio marinus TaxID=568069 RepID=A0A1J1IV07_9DIPT|nr:CLUMA_CG016256, isoform A [Clunio marinus]
MKFLIVFALCIVAALAAPPTGDVSILKSNFANTGETYAFDFEQSDGQKRDETGEVRNIGTENEGIAVKGSFSFVADDGQTYTVTYVADENGFQPSAAHLPQLLIQRRYKKRRTCKLHYQCFFSFFGKQSQNIKMKFLIVFALCIVAALAAPADVEITKSSFDNIGIDGYSFDFEQSDGQKREESAVVNNLGSENESIAVRGSFSFIGDDGQTYTVTYVADENVFKKKIKMKFLIVFALCFVAALAAPADVEILKSNFENIGVDGYKFDFEQSDGQKREESAVVNNLGSENESIAVRGSFSFVGDDGQTYTVTYIADENGFQPSAAHLPVA